MAHSDIEVTVTKKKRGEHNQFCVLTSGEKPVGKMKSTTRFYGCYSDKDAAEERATALRNGTYKKKRKPAKKSKARKSRKSRE